MQKLIFFTILIQSKTLELVATISPICSRRRRWIRVYVYRNSHCKQTCCYYSYWLTRMYTEGLVYIPIIHTIILAWEVLITIQYTGEGVMAEIPSWKVTPRNLLAGVCKVLVMEGGDAPLLLWAAIAKK